MGRLARKQMSNGIYHVYNRSANTAWILDRADLKDKFLELMERYAKNYSLNIYHYSIMSNHFHLAIDGRITEISGFISGLCSHYSRYWHGQGQNGFGPIWQGRYKSVIVQKEKYLHRLGRYIELNPVRANIIKQEELQTYRWSSARFYLTGEASCLVAPHRHPMFMDLPEYGSEESKQYLDYLQIPYDEDIVLFRSSARQIGDESFLNRLISLGGRVKLRAGRPSKQSGI